MPNVKGAAITARLRFLRERHGEGGLRRVLDALPPEERAMVDARILPQSWAPYRLFVHLSVEADRLFGKGDYALCYEMGRFAAEVNLPTLYRLFYKLGNPLFIMRRAAQLWSVHYDSGRMVPVEGEPGVIRLRIEDFESPHRAHCQSVLGWASKSIELSGGILSGAEEERCRTRGADACELVARYR